MLPLSAGLEPPRPAPAGLVLINYIYLCGSSASVRFLPPLPLAELCCAPCDKNTREYTQSSATHRARPARQHAGTPARQHAGTPILHSRPLNPLAPAIPAPLVLPLAPRLALIHIYIPTIFALLVPARRRQRRPAASARTATGCRGRIDARLMQHPLNVLDVRDRLAQYNGFRVGR